MSRIRAPSLLQLQILTVLASSKTLYGLEIIAIVGTKSGSFYPAARTLADRGLVKVDKEVVDPYDAGRPPRNYYEIQHGGLELVERYTSQFGEARS